MLRGKDRAKRGGGKAEEAKMKELRNEQGWAQEGGKAALRSQ